MEFGMKTNVGKVDKVIRLLLAIALFSLFFLLPGQQKWLGLLGLVPLLTGAINWCPIYAILGIDTCKLR